MYAKGKTPNNKTKIATTTGASTRSESTSEAEAMLNPVRLTTRPKRKAAIKVKTKAMRAEKSWKTTNRFKVLAKGVCVIHRHTVAPIKKEAPIEPK